LDPRRHRLHVGARSPPLHTAGLRVRAPLRHGRLASRPPGGPDPVAGRDEGGPQAPFVYCPKFRTSYPVKFGVWLWASAGGVWLNVTAWTWAGPVVVVAALFGFVAAVVVVVLFDDVPGLAVVVVVPAPPPGPVVVVVALPGVVPGAVVVVVPAPPPGPVVVVVAPPGPVVVVVAAAGPGPGQNTPPVGTTDFASMCPMRTSARWLVGSGTRSLIRTTSTAAGAVEPSGPVG